MRTVLKAVIIGFVAAMMFTGCEWLADTFVSDSSGAGNGNEGPDAPQSDAQIYFAEAVDGCANKTIKRYDAAEGTTEEVASLSGPDSVRDMTLDLQNGRIYFSFGGSSGNNTDTIKAVGFDGRNPETLATYGPDNLDENLGPVGIAFDPLHEILYWLTDPGCGPCGCSTSCHQLVSLDLNDGTPSTLYEYSDSDSDYRNLHGLAYDPASSRLYFSDSQNEPVLQRADTDAPAPTTVVSANAEGIADVAIHHSANKLYWLDRRLGVSNPRDIKRADSDGSSVESLITVGGSQEEYPRGVDVDPEEEKLYWSESGFCGQDPSGGRIYRANLDGTNPEVVVSGLTVVMTLEVAR